MIGYKVPENKSLSNLAFSCPSDLDYKVSDTVIFFFCVPQLYLFGSLFWVILLRMWPFFNPTIEVVTFRLRGWCVLDVFLLPAFTHLRHECQDLWSPCDGMHVCTDWTSVYTLIRKSLGGMESASMLTPREKSPLLEKFFSEEDRTHNTVSSRTVSPAHYQLSYSGPWHWYKPIKYRRGDMYHTAQVNWNTLTGVKVKNINTKQQV